MTSTTAQNFIELLMKYISYDGNQAELVTNMKIRDFLENSIDFKEFVVAVKEHSPSLTYNSDEKYLNEMRYLNDYANRLIYNNTDLKDESLDDLKKSLEQKIAPVKLEKFEHESVLVVTGTNIVLSEIIEQVEEDPGFANGELNEVQIVAWAVLHVDRGLTKEKWHGKNLAVWTDMLNITTENIVWNFSGNDRQEQFSENAGTDNEGNGIDGKDGKPGESGGNVFIKAERVQNGEQLKIISIGGKGGPGQDGGNGHNGVDGVSVTIEDFDKIFDSAHTTYTVGETNYEKAKKIISSYSKSSPCIIEEKGGRWGNSYINSEFQNGFEVSYLNFQLVKGLTLVRGSKGTSGDKGGNRGLGGEGGFPGQIELDVPRNSHIKKENFKGNCGRDGNGGCYGRNGIKGADMARLSWIEDNAFSAILLGVCTAGMHTLYQYANSNITGQILNRFYGEGENQYFQLYNTSYNDDESIYCLNSDKYVKISNAGSKPNEEVTAFVETNNSKPIRERQQHALALRQRSLNISEMQELYKESFAKMHFSAINKIEVTTDKNVEEQQVEDKFQQDMKITRNLSSSNKCLKKKEPNVMEANSIKVVEINEEYEATDLSELIIARYDALAVIGSKLSTDIYELKNGPETLEEFLDFKNKKSEHHVLADLNMSKEDQEEDRKKQFSSLKKLSKKFSQSNKTESIVKEFIKETNHACFRRFEKFATDKLKKLLMIVEEYDEMLSSNTSVDKKKVVLEEIKKIESEDRNILCGNEYIVDELPKHLTNCGRDFPTFLELVSQKHMLNIRIYVKDEAKQKFILQENYNPRSTAAIYLVKVNNKFEELEPNDQLYEYQQYRKNAQNKYRRIMNDIEQCSSVEAIDSYVKNRLYNKPLPSENIEEISALCNFVISGDRSFIVKLFAEHEQSKDAQNLTEKLETMILLGAGSTVHYMADRLRNSENPNISIRDINLVINTVLLLLAQQNQMQFTIIDWIVVTRKPEEWIVHLTLVRLENNFQERIKQKDYIKWETYLKKVENKNIIILLCLKLSTIEKGAFDMNKVETILHLLSKAEPDIVAVSNLKLQEWTYVLKEYYWRHELVQLVNWKKEDQDMQKAVHFLLRIENKHQFYTTSALMEAFSKGIVASEEDKLGFMEILQKFADDAWSITDEVLRSIKQSSKVSEWKSSIEGMMPQADHIRTADDLTKIIEAQLKIESSSGNPDLKSAQTRILEKIADIKNSMEEVKTFTHQLKQWKEDNIKQEALESKYRSAKVEKLLAMIDHAVYLWSEERDLGRGFHMRDTQKLSALIVVKHDRKTLLQVATGEGKSIIVAAVAIIRVLSGQQVDVITTSSVLAERDVQELKDLYAMFNITVSHNTANESSIRQTAYKSDVVYGDLASFQRDHLLDQFYNKGIRGDRRFSSVVVDEVDSMLLDKGNSTLYLSHEIPELDKLESIYIYIWTRVILGKTTNETQNLLWDTKVIASEIKKSLYGLIDEEDVKQLKRNMDAKTVTKILEVLRNENIIDNDDFLVNDETFSGQALQLLLEKHEDTKELKDHLLVLLQQRIERERFIASPRYLKPFILENLNRWIHNAKLALYLRDRDDYIVDVDRHNKDKNDTMVTILDKDTGTDQVNSQWDSGLHQFLQLKHGCRLTPQSLKAVFISNVSYFKKYDQLNGLSGTLGSEVERQHLVEAHNVDFLTIPTFKQKQFSEELPIVTSTMRNWNTSIFEESIKKIKADRSVLIICDSVNSVEQLYEVFLKEEQCIFTVHKYTRDFEKLLVIHAEKKLTAGHLIIATNLAGRGTDLKLDDSLIKAGGLHVIVTYLTINDRIEQQAFGRAARKGDPGSGQLIIFSEEFVETNVSSYRISKLKSQRRLREAEHVSTVRKHYEDQIKYEEDCFLRFNNAWEINRARLSDSDIEPKVQELLERGVLNKWAFWLDSNMGHDNKIDGDNIHAKINDFIETVTSFSLEINNWGTWVDDLAQSISLGKISAKTNENAEAGIQIFDRVIQNEPDFCEAALYYKALALFHSGKDIGTIVDTLSKARILFEKRKEFCEFAKAIIANVKQRTAMANSQCESFEHQQEQIIKIQNTFIRSIDDIIGHCANEKLLDVPDTSIFETKFAMAKLRKETGFISHMKLDVTLLKKFLGSHCESKGINLDNFERFIKNHGDLVEDEAKYNEALESNVDMPNREEFWKILEQANVLHDGKTFCHLYLNEIGIMEPALKDKILAVEKLKAVPSRYSLFNFLYLYPEFVDESSKYLTFEESVFLDTNNFQEGTLPYLKEHKLLCVNKCAKVDLEKLKNYSFEKYGSLQLSDLITSTIKEETAKEIIEELVNLDVLVKEGNDIYRPTKKYFEFDFESSQVNFPPLYMEMIRKKLDIIFSYAIAAHQLLKSNSYNKGTCLPLIPRAYESLVEELKGHGVICKPKLNVTLANNEERSKKQIREKLRKTFDRVLKLTNLTELPTVTIEIANTIIADLVTKEVLTDMDFGNYIVQHKMSGSERKTVQLLVNTIYKISSDDYISSVADMIYTGMGTIHIYGDQFQLGTKPLSEVMQLETKEEELQFLTNGQDEILIGQKANANASYNASCLTNVVIFSSIVILIVGGAVLAIRGEFASAMDRNILYIEYLLNALLGQIMLVIRDTNDFVLKILAEKSIRFLAAINKNVKNHVQKNQSTFVQGVDEKISQVVKSNLEKLNSTKSPSQYENIVLEVLNGFAGKIMELIRGEITKAMDLSNIGNSIRLLYEQFDQKLVTSEINKNDEFVLTWDRFAGIMQPAIHQFKAYVIENVDEMTKKLGVDDLETISKFKNRLQKNIDAGIELCRQKHSDIFKTLKDNVLSLYEDGLNGVQSNLVKLAAEERNSKVTESMTKVYVEAKYNGISQSLTKSSQILLDKMKTDIEKKVKQSIYEKVNSLISKQIYSKNDYTKMVHIRFNEEHLYQTQDLQDVKLSLIEDEYDAVHALLVSQGKFNQLPIEQKTNNTHDDVTDDFKKISENLIKSYTIGQYNTILHRHRHIFESALHIFANQSENNKLINEVLHEVASSSDSKTRQNVKTEIDHLAQSLVKNRNSKYSFVLKRLCSIFQNKPITNCFNEFYKITVLAAIESNNETWIKNNTLHRAHSTQSEIGMLKLNNSLIIAATHNTKQPFIWETFKVLDKNASSDDIIILKGEKQLDKTVPSVKLQLLKYIDKNFKKTDVPSQITLHINGQTQEINSVLPENLNIALDDLHTYLSYETINLIYKFKDYLSELHKIALYCELNRDQFVEKVENVESYERMIELEYD